VHDVKSGVNGFLKTPKLLYLLYDGVRKDNLCEIQKHLYFIARYFERSLFASKVQKFFCLILYFIARYFERSRLCWLRKTSSALMCFCKLSCINQNNIAVG
jgi:hypothetical protein